MKEQKWDEIIKSKRGWFDVRLSELWQYRDLVFLFVKRDFVSFYKQTILGPLWYIIQPLFTTVVFTVIFGKLAQLSTDSLPAPLFYLAGITCWGYFAECLNQTSNTFINNSHIFGKVYFPRLTVPISIVISKLISFGIQFSFFLIFLIYFSITNSVVHISMYVFILPILLIIIAIQGLGIGIIISSLTTKYRDLRFLVQFGVQLLMYATPVIYPLSSIPDKYKLFILANPMTAVIESFRFAFLGTGSFSWLSLGYSFAISIILFFIGILLFNRIESTFMDTV